MNATFASTLPHELTHHEQCQTDRDRSVSAEVTADNKEQQPPSSSEKAGESCTAASTMMHPHHHHHHRQQPQRPQRISFRKEGQPPTPNQQNRSNRNTVLGDTSKVTIIVAKDSGDVLL